MFQSYYISFCDANNSDIIHINDQEFTASVIVPSYYFSFTVLGIAIAQEYGQRKLDVGKNLARAVIWEHETYRYSIQYIIDHQDRYCPMYINNWSEYAKSRDEYLKKFLVWC